MTNRYRLSSSTYEREEDNKIEPKKVFFLSVEGNTTGNWTTRRIYKITQYREYRIRYT